MTTEQFHPNTKIVYQLDAHGWFVSQAVAFVSPLESGVYMIPAGCVEEMPPEEPEGKRALAQACSCRLSRLRPSPTRCGCSRRSWPRTPR